jgi:hypothetical protein
MHLPAGRSEFGDVPVAGESAPILFCDAVSGKDHRDAVAALLGMESLYLVHTTLSLQSGAPANHVDLAEYLMLFASAQCGRCGRDVSADGKRYQ